MNSDPVKRHTSSTETGLVLIETMVKDFDFGELIVISCVTKGNMVIRFVEHVVLGLLAIEFNVCWIKID